MIYVLAAATATMGGYMFWLAAFRMRPERVWGERERSRGKHAFRPKERVRYLLGRTFDVPPDRPEWEDTLVSRLADIDTADRQPSGAQQ